MELWHANEARASRVDRLGVDVARSGADKTCIALRTGQRIAEIQLFSEEDTMKTVRRIQTVLGANPGAVTVVDADGVGGGVVDRLRELHPDVVAFHASKAPKNLGSSEEVEFINSRAAAWWNLAQMLDPERGSLIELPPHEFLLGDLTAPRSDSEFDRQAKTGRQR